MTSILQAPFEGDLPPPDAYPAAAEDPLSFFPSLPKLHGDARYEADARLPAKDSNNCRKASYGHPTLSPGVFTIYCEHGVCYGFEVLQRCESPRHPFRIFKSQFSRPPQLIIYDNACRLHVYCLNREPQFFKGTRFAVDRFHWRGHVGCSKGYSLDAYIDRQVKGINSQINEQANSGLQRIKGQLAYMGVENFIFHCSLFLAIKNMDKKRGLSLGRLHL